MLTADTTWWWAPPPRPRPRAAVLEVSAAADLAAGIGRLADELAAEQKWREEIAAGIATIDVPAVGAFTTGPYLQAMWGPKDGFFWFVQRLTVGTMVPSDVLQVYRGASVADIAGQQNLLNSWQGSNGAVQVWNPGRTGGMIKPRQTLIFTGALTAGPYVANADVIQVEARLVPYFLL